jgi:hypothetical protein
VTVLLKIDEILSSTDAPRLDELLRAVVGFLMRYVAFTTSAQAVAVALWILHTHAFEAAETSPYLHISSPEKRSGKSRLLDTLELLVAKPWRVVEPSVAVLFRRIERDGPALLMDEADAIFKGRSETYQELRGLLNAGNRRGTKVARCSDHGRDLKDFDVFCPKAIAGIGDLPDTITDRSIAIRLQRKTRSERVERFRYRDASERAAVIRDPLEAWGRGSIEELRAARPLIPEVLNDRAADGWEALFAIADLAGGDWSAKARQAAVELCGVADDESIGVLLLRHIQDAFGDSSSDRLSSRDLLEHLCNREDGAPWAGWWGDALSRNSTKAPASRLAKLLRPFGIAPKKVWVEDHALKGYALADFAEPWARYLDSAGSDGLPLQGEDSVERKVGIEQVGGEVSSEDAETPFRPNLASEQGTSDLPLKLGQVAEGDETEDAIEAIQQVFGKLEVLEVSPNGRVSQAAAGQAEVDRLADDSEGVGKETDRPPEPATAAANPDKGPPATEVQKRALAIIASRLGWSDEERHRRAGVASFNDLEKSQASRLIEEWGSL